jgi:hypothetical protein
MEPPSSSWQAPTPADVQVLLPGYDVGAMLGRGGMGAVYRATQKSLDRPVAIKVLPPQSSDAAPGHAERFKHEARTLARLSHPGIVSIFESGELPGGQVYFVMEFVDGSDLAQTIRDAVKLPPDRAISVVGEVCEALEYAHSLGVIHRDIKPANILLGRDGRPKVADFGLAKAEAAANLGLTASNVALGTHDFAAPEVLTPGAVVDRRADLYAVGVMLYQLLTGDLPRGLFKLPSQKVPGLDARFDAIVCRALEAAPEDRYPTAAAIRADLEAIRTTPAPARPPPAADEANPTPRVRRLPAKTLAAVGTLAALAVTVVVVIALPKPARKTVQRPAAPVLVPETGWTNLLAALPEEPEGLTGNWRLDHGELKHPETVQVPFQTLELPTPKTLANYDLRLRLSRRSGTGAVVVAFRHGDAGGMVILDAFTGTGNDHDLSISQISTDFTGTVARVDGLFLEQGRPHEILVQVRDDSVTASLNGEERVRWPADWRRIRQHEPNYFPPALIDRPILGVGVCCSEMTFHSVEFREVGGDLSP